VGSVWFGLYISTLLLRANNSTYFTTVYFTQGSVGSLCFGRGAEDSNFDDDGGKE
jgi:hypothetical protein